MYFGNFVTGGKIHELFEKGGYFFAIQSVLINEIFWTTCQSRPLHAAFTFHHFLSMCTYETNVVRFERTCHHCLLAVPLKKYHF